MFFAILAIVGGVAFFVWLGNKTDIEEPNRKLIERIIEENIDNVSLKYIEKTAHNAIALSEKDKKIYVIKANRKDDYGLALEYDKQGINFDEIIESEVVIDDETVSKTSRGSQLGGAVVGGALLGGVGAIVGGLSAQKKSFKKVKSIDMKLTLDNLQNPICNINFLNNIITYAGKDKGIGGYKTDHEEYKVAIESVEKWQGIMDIILNKPN